MEHQTKRTKSYLYLAILFFSLSFCCFLYTLFFIPNHTKIMFSVTTIILFFLSVVFILIYQKNLQISLRIQYQDIGNNRLIDQLFTAYETKVLENLFDENKFPHIYSTGYILKDLTPYIEIGAIVDKLNLIVIEFYKDEFRYTVMNKNVEAQDMQEESFRTIDYSTIHHRLEELMIYINEVIDLDLTTNQKEYQRYPAKHLMKSYHGKTTYLIFGQSFYINGGDVMLQLNEKHFIKYVLVKTGKERIICKAYRIEGKTIQFNLAVDEISNGLTRLFLIRQIDFLRLYFRKWDPRVDSIVNNGLKKEFLINLIIKIIKTF